MNRDKFIAILEKLGVPPPEKEYKIYIRGKAKGEKPCRIDYAWADLRIAVEIEGGVWSRGRHVRGLGYLHDMKKYNWLNINGWLLLRYTWQTINYDEIKDVYFSTKKAVEKLNKIKL